jgi:hypothetical protein
MLKVTTKRRKRSKNLKLSKRRKKTRATRMQLHRQRPKSQTHNQKSHPKPLRRMKKIRKKRP